MRGLWMLVHVLGFTLWLGGGIATMVAGVSAKRLGTRERLAAYKLIGAVQRLLVGPGAVAVRRDRRRGDQRADGGEAGAARAGPERRITRGVSPPPQAADRRRHDRRHAGAHRAVCGDPGPVVTPR